MRNLIWEKYEIERAMLTFIFIAIFYVSFTAFKSIWHAFYRMEMMVLVHVFFIAFFNEEECFSYKIERPRQNMLMLYRHAFFKRNIFQYLWHPFYDGVFECYNGFIEG